MAGSGNALNTKEAVETRIKTDDLRRVGISLPYPLSISSSIVSVTAATRGIQGLTDPLGGRHLA